MMEISSNNLPFLQSYELVVGAPGRYVLRGDERIIFKNYTDMVDFEAIKASGWSYSKINNTNLLYEDSNTSMIHVNFSRYKEDDSVLTTHDFSYLLVADDVDWKIKAALSAGEIVLGNSE